MWRVGETTFVDDLDCDAMNLATGDSRMEILATMGIPAQDTVFPLYRMTCFAEIIQKTMRIHDSCAPPVAVYWRSTTSKR